MKIILTIDGIDYEVGKKIPESTNSFVVESIQLEKEMYKPGCINIKLSSDAKLASIKDINDSLLKKKVSLTIKDGSQEYSYAKNYIIFGITPVIKRSNTHTSTILNLKVYSPDQYLTLKKYSKAWTAKRLCNDIITTEIKLQDQLFNESVKDPKTAEDKGEAKQGETNEEAQKNTLIQKSFNLYHLQNGENEFMQPYLVQYNESFYDFMVRTANRCGEFVYFENDELNIGLPQKGNDPKPLDEKYSELSYNTVVVNEEDDIAAHNYLSEHEYPEKDGYNYEGLSDEYLEKIDKKGNTEGWENEIYWPECPAIDTVTSALSEDTLTDMVIQAGIGLAQEVGRAHGTARLMNGKYNGKYFNGNFDKIQYSAEEDSLSQFTDWENKDKYNNNFYIETRKHEENAKANAIHIKYNAQCPNLMLGSNINFENLNYTITKVYTQISNLNDKIVILTEIDALPWQGKEKEEKLPYPFPLKDKSIRKAGNQVAFVVDNDDPLRLGRVRIRYPWQQTSDATPWIRVATLMASDGTGINFVANNGDEVMIGYEYGNVERPYVVGALYNDTNQPDTGSTCKHIISSPNGHTIKFSDPPNGSGAFASIYPGLAFLKKYFPQIPLFKNSTVEKDLAGGISMYDSYGFYDISMSTDSRAVSISSPLGKVSIDAFTGISIEAPNGDVSITGKNVSITAGNSIKITSGQNIDNEMLRWPGINHLKKFGKELGKNIGFTVLDETVNKFIDLGILRTLIETFIRPIGGEMLIKSYRNIRMEAGKGSAKLPTRFWTETAEREAKNEEKATKNALKSETLKRQIMPPIKSMLGYINRMIQNDFDCKIEVYCTEYENFRTRFQAQLENAQIKDAFAQWQISELENDIKAKDFDNKISTKLNNFYAAIKDAAEESNMTSGITKLKKISKDLSQTYFAFQPEGNIKNEVAKNAFNSLPTEVRQALSPNFSIKKEYTIPSRKDIRKALHAVLEKLKENKLIDIDEDAAEENEVSVKDVDKICSNQENWANYIDCLKIVEKDKKLRDHGLIKYLGEKTKILPIIDNCAMWGKNYTSGEILFSDKDGSQTIRFENGSLVTSQKSLIEEIKDFLINF